MYPSNLGVPTDFVRRACFLSIAKLRISMLQKNAWTIFYQVSKTPRRDAEHVPVS